MPFIVPRMDDDLALDPLRGWRGRTIGPVELLDRIDSTNAEALRRTDRGLVADGRVLLARLQTAGHGSRGRSWDSPAGAALALTAWLRWPMERSPLLATWAGALSVADAAAAYGVSVRLKWPNDALVGGCKLAGVLAEMRAFRGGTAVALGIGMNVLQDAAELPRDAATPPTSLRIEGATASLRAAGRALLEALDARLGEAFAHPQTTADAFASALQIRGRRVEVTPATSSRPFAAQFERLHEDGTLSLLREEEGAGRLRLSGGHVLALRPVEPADGS
jgi:BirA family biotin operon repressor/biotin-[acetyl-CoA-carboxylase] ligase